MILAKTQRITRKSGLDTGKILVSSGTEPWQAVTSGTDKALAGRRLSWWRI